RPTSLRWLPAARWPRQCRGCRRSRSSRELARLRWEWRGRFDWGRDSSWLLVRLRTVTRLVLDFEAEPGRRRFETTRRASSPILAHRQELSRAFDARTRYESCCNPVSLRLRTRPGCDVVAPRPSPCRGCRGPGLAVGLLVGPGAPARSSWRAGHR